MSQSVSTEKLIEGNQSTLEKGLSKNPEKNAEKNSEKNLSWFQRNKPLAIALITLAVIVVIGIIAAANSGNSTKEDTANANSVSRQEQNNPESVAKKTNVTTGQKNALKSAKNYLSLMGFSKSGLIKQLEFDGYSSEDATYAAENCNANWNEQAAKSAKNYLDTMPFSKSELIHQLEFDGYSKEETEYGAQSAGY